MGKKKRFLSICISILLLLGLVACGGKKEETGESAVSVDSTTPGSNGEYVYVPTFNALKGMEENKYVGNAMFRGDKFYYTLNEYIPETDFTETKLMAVDINDASKAEQIELPAFEEEDYTTRLSIVEMDTEGNLYVAYFLSPLYEEGEEIGPDDCKDILIKYDKDMNLVYQSDLKDMYVDENNTYLSSMVVGKDGKLIASSNNVIYVIGADGTPEKSIPTNADYINRLFATEDGRIFFTQYSPMGPGMEMIEVDTREYTLGEAFKDLPNMNGNVKAGPEGKLLMPGDKYLYEYDLETGVATPILDWMDSYVTADFITDYKPLDNGDFIIYYEDWNNGSKELVKLTKTKASEIPEKETIVFASLYPTDQIIEHAILEFNKANPSYKMVNKSYVDDMAQWTEDTYNNAVAALNMDIISDNPPDIIDLMNVNVPNLAAKGVFEDLNPYLDKSTVIKREDFVPSALNGYTFEGTLVTIPRSMDVYTLLGKESMVGDKEGCTIEDLMQLSNRYPDSDLMAYATKESVLSQFLRFNNDAFIDIETGTCSFNSPEFIRLLEYANTYDLDADYTKDLPELIQENEVLLLDLNLRDVASYQMYHMMMGEEATCIGYPTVDGSQGVFFNGSNICGITTKSTHKDAAWKFMESFLKYDGQQRMHYGGLSTRLDELEERFEEDMTPEYEKDVNGEYKKDAEGNLIEYPKATWGYGDNWEATIYAATKEEIDAVKALIYAAKPAFENDEEIQAIIQEETAAYFNGQKSANEVADIIQSRVSIYISENS